MNWTSSRIAPMLPIGIAIVMVNTPAAIYRAAPGSR